MNWEQLLASDATEVQLAVELNDEEPSNYEEDDFEEPMSEKNYQDPVQIEQVASMLSTIKYVCQIKKVQKSNIL